MKNLLKIMFGLVILSLIGTLVLYPLLPPKVPSHWNFNWEIDGYSNKPFVFVMATLPLIIYLLLILVPKIDPRRDSYQKHHKAYNAFIAVLMLMLIVVHWLIILTALNIPVNARLLFSLAMGSLLIVSGNYMGQIRQNYTFGIKTPWTLADETVWKKTHRKGGLAFIISGLVFILGGFVPNSYPLLIGLTFLMLAIIYLTIYSYLEFKKIKSKPE
ncbi:MAG TPA: SdpI family protein [Bacillota bacterium]|nr:SdpI family protein [Bacillota bacterium]HOL10687.1 SdpI family protein [Bacillota bacterium]HPO98500.1 SdpI family protein [Bacillota bacterium]